MNEINRVIMKDALDGLKMLPDKCIDVIITSPPYNKTGLQGVMKGANWNKNIVYGDTVELDNMIEKDYQMWQLELLKQMYRVLKDDGSLFYNHKNRIHQGEIISPLRWISLSPFKVRQQIVWDRGSGPNVHPCRFIPSTEFIFWLTKCINPSFKRSDCTFKSEVWKLSPQRNTEHPAPFPIEIPDNILRCIPNEGNKIVLDPFMGSGTTALSAEKNGWNWLGFEIIEDYIKMTQRRLDEYDLYKNNLI